MIYGQPVTFGGASGEIDITDNGTFDVKKYATANVNVAPVLLWTNASPTSAFTPQTISLDGSLYNGYIVELRYFTSRESFQSFYLPIDSVQRILCFPSAATSFYDTVAKRFVTPNQNGIVFGDGGSDTQYSDNYGIPTRIWGVKFTL